MNIWKTLIESALVSSIIYIYVFLLDSLIPGDIKQKVAYFHIGKLPGYTIFTKMKQSVRDDVNRYMRSVMREEPIDPSLEIIDDAKSW